MLSQRLVHLLVGWSRSRLSRKTPELQVALRDISLTHEPVQSWLYKMNPLQKPFLVIGHRGAKGLAPENTVRSILEAISAGVDGIEIDVHAAHGQLWVIHDRRLERTTNGTGNLDDVTPEALRTLDAGDGQHIPSLGEVIMATGDRGLLNIELKDAESASLVVETVREHVKSNPDWSKDQFLISSFSVKALESLRELSLELRVGLLPEAGQTANEIWSTAKALEADSVHLQFPFITRHLVEAANDRGLKIYAYTVNTFQEAALLKEQEGIDGIISDFPDRMQRLRVPQPPPGR